MKHRLEDIVNSRRWFYWWKLNIYYSSSNHNAFLMLLLSYLLSVFALIFWIHQGTWRQSRESQRCWGLRSQWGAPWCLQPAQSTVREIKNIFRSLLFQEVLKSSLDTSWGYQNISCNTEVKYRISKAGGPVKKDSQHVMYLVNWQLATLVPPHLVKEGSVEEEPHHLKLRVIICTWTN